MPAKAIMIQGTGSHVGKSLLATALCRIFVQEGYRVLPFKAQNMSNNSFVTGEGREISRAQAEQAKACKVEPSVRMNPILLKPTTDVGSQVVLLGKPIGNLIASEYESFKPRLSAAVKGALHGLMEEAEIVVIEGAGSPAEINLKEHDLVNMWVAKEAQAKVLLVGDIDRGGVFAQLVGTMDLLDETEKGLVRAFLINKFRGDYALLESGIRWLEKRCGVPVLGTIPYLRDVRLAQEDTPSQRDFAGEAAADKVRVEVIQLPRMSNFTDFDSLAQDPDVQLSFVDRPSLDAVPDCVILPGSKSTIADLAFVRAQGFDRCVRRWLESGTEIVGICGGFQMLCRQILDPEHVEATVSAAPGLGLLPGVTLFHQGKTVARVRGVHLESGLPVTGYEIHMGQMKVEEGAASVFKFTQRGESPAEIYDGSSVSGGRIWGTHLHGLFDEPGFRSWWLNRLRRRRGLEVRSDAPGNPGDLYDRLADTVRPHLNLELLRQILELT